MTIASILREHEQRHLSLLRLTLAGPDMRIHAGTFRRVSRILSGRVDANALLGNRGYHLLVAKAASVLKFYASQHAVTKKRWAASTSIDISSH